MAKKIKKAIFWMQKALEVLGQRTALPDKIEETIIPTLSAFGWERLFEAPGFDTSGAAAPASTVVGPVTPQDILRLVIHASVVHTDTGVDHNLWIDKVMAIAGQTVGISAAGVQVPINVDVGLDRWIWLGPGEIMRGRADVALVAGALVLDICFIDLPLGEYIPH